MEMVEKLAVRENVWKEVDQLIAKDFIAHVKRTEFSVIGLKEERLLHGLLGIVNELGELASINIGSRISGAVLKVGDISEIDLNIQEELGDLLWYFALVMDAVNLDLSFLRGKVGYKFNFDKMVMYEIGEKATLWEITSVASIACSNIIGGVIKASIYYERTIDMKIIGAFMFYLAGVIAEVCVQNKYNIIDIMSINKEKLKKRYPKEFSAEKANNRNLSEEVKGMKIV